MNLWTPSAYRRRERTGRHTDDVRGPALWCGQSPLEQGALPAGAVGNSAAISPLTLTPYAWYPAGVGQGYSGGFLNSWADASGRGDSNRNLAKSGVGPAFTGAGNASYHNYPVATFSSATTTAMVSGTWSSAVTAGFSIVIIGEFDTGGGAANAMFDGNASLESTCAYNNATGTSCIQLATGYSSYAASTVAATPSMYVWTFETYFLWQYWAGIFKGDASLATVPSLPGLTLGALFGPVDTLQGIIAECLIVQPLNASQLGGLAAYYSAKFGVVV